MMLSDKFELFRHWLKDQEIDELRKNNQLEADVIRDIREDFEAYFNEELNFKTDSNE